jgi:hypothetical protein
MFSTQDSVDFNLTSGIPSRELSSSPVRKKGRGKCKEKDGNLFGFSQEPVQYSQFSQNNFVDRLGQLNVFCSQENSNISFPAIQQTVAKSDPMPNFPSSATDAKCSMCGNIKVSLDGNESERAIEIAAPLQNIFHSKAGSGKPHCEMYFEKVSTVNGTNSQKPKSTTVWIGAFKERSRIITEFEELRVLGEGTFSCVLCARHRMDGMMYAVKRIKESIVHERQGRSLLREVHSLALLQGCPQIVRYFSSWLDNHHLYIQTELCHLGCLEDLISRTPNVSSIISLSAVALCTLHSKAQVDLFAEAAQRRNLTLQQMSGSGNVHTNAFSRQRAESFAVLRTGSSLSVPVGACDSPPQCLSSSGAVGVASHKLPPASAAESSNTYCEQNHLEQPPPRGISEPLAWKILSEIGKALAFIHEQGFSFFSYFA